MKTVFEQFNDLLRDDEYPQAHDYVESKNDIKILKEEKVFVEKDNKEYTIQLLFATTPGHGYFGFLNGIGELFLVGEEDDGIDNEDIMDIFEVDEYGRSLA